jgi:hypothetical protein
MNKYTFSRALLHVDASHLDEIDIFGESPTVLRVSLPHLPTMLIPQLGLASAPTTATISAPSSRTP